MLAALVAAFGDLDLAEDALQEALVVALARWPRDGVPANPGGWITTTARRKALDRLRREASRDHKEEASSAVEPLDPADDDGPVSAVPDQRLRLLFTCCHPALALEAQVALTLRTLGGLATPEIAHAFLVPEATMAKRLVRAKLKIRRAAIPYRVPADHQLPERLVPVLRVVYLIFTEGHAATGGDHPLRQDLCAEAVRLARLLVDLMPDESEAIGLLALLLLQDARRGARIDADGRAVLLADQHRGRWDRLQIAEGVHLVERALRRRQPGSYQLQAAIAAVHAQAPSVAATDWRQVAALYGELARAGASTRTGTTPRPSTGEVEPLVRPTPRTPGTAARREEQ